jgi:putative endonuclease
MASQRNGTIYIGVTNDLPRRSWEHAEGKVAGFTKIYGLKNLVYYEEFPSITAAIAREKKLKGWKRERKLELIEAKNPQWLDLRVGL